MVEKRNIGGRLLRCGYTTGSCAAAAAKAATRMLLDGTPIESVDLLLPGGERLTLCVQQAEIHADFVSCAVQKDSGDDPDVTNGMLIFAKVCRIEQGVSIDGGVGIGRVTKPGLDQPVGAVAINSVPRKMITASVLEACIAFGYSQGISVVISAPEGEALAKRTFNPQLGIVGGLSIIGTTGIVEPMSNRALIDTIRLELRQLSESGSTHVLLTPGNYGADFAKDRLSLSLKAHISCSNFIGDAIDSAVELGFTDILLVGHIGKLVKLGIGQTNTHSSAGDGRIETLIACALQAGANLPLLNGLLSCVTTDATLTRIAHEGLLESSMEILGNRIEGCLIRRVPDSIRIGYVCFSNAEPFSGILVQSKNAADLLEIWRTL